MTARQPISAFAKIGSGCPVALRTPFLAQIADWSSCSAASRMMLPVLSKGLPPRELLTRDRIDNPLDVFCRQWRRTACCVPCLQQAERDDWIDVVAEQMPA